VTVSPAGKTFSSSRFTTEYGHAKRIVKAALGHAPVQRHLPAFKPTAARVTRRDFCPLLPEPRSCELRADAAAHAAPFSCASPQRLQIRQRKGTAHLDAGSRRFMPAALAAPAVPLELFFAIALPHHFHEMPYLVDHAARFRRVLALDHLVHSAQAEAADVCLMSSVAADKTHHPLDLYFAAGLLVVVLVGVSLRRAFWSPLF